KTTGKVSKTSKKDKPNASGWDITPLDLAALLEATSGHPAEQVLHQKLLYSMMQAVYQVENTGHFGLGLTHYLHFTSPIRRYPDLWVHRMLKLFWQHKRRLPGKKKQAFYERIVDSAAQSSKREREAMYAERDVYGRYKARLMKRYLGEVFEGTISGLASFGFFVTLERPFVDGLVLLRDLDGYYLYDPERMRIENTDSGQSFQVGDKVQIQVASVDVERGQIDFALLPESHYDHAET
ncbi:MAG: RNB domain-containing ribonuclease, partial [Myxococcota bacterium]